MEQAVKNTQYGYRAVHCMQRSVVYCSVHDTIKCCTCRGCTCRCRCTIPGVHGHGGGLAHGHQVLRLPHQLHHSLHRRLMSVCSVHHSITVHYDILRGRLGAIDRHSTRFDCLVPIFDLISSKFFGENVDERSVQPAPFGVSGVVEHVGKHAADVIG